MLGYKTGNFQNLFFRAQVLWLKALLVHFNAFALLIGQSDESRKRMDTILMKLTTDISNLQKALEFRKPTSKIVGRENQIPSMSQNYHDDPRGLPVEKFKKSLDISQELTFLEWFRTMVDDFLGKNCASMRVNSDEKPVSEY